MSNEPQHDEPEKRQTEREVFLRWIAEACAVLFSVEEEANEGPEKQRLLRERGLKLVRDLMKPPSAEVVGLGLAGVEKYAKRYAWLRERHQALCTMQAAQAIGLDLSKTFVQSPEQLDDAIDAAITRSVRLNQHERE